MPKTSNHSLSPVKRRRSTRKRKNPTVVDVAKHADVSTATVSRYLSAADSIKPELRKRVEAAITKLDYVLTGSARALRTQRSQTIGVIVPTLDTASFAAGVHALQETLFAADHAPLLALSNYDPELELRHAKNLVKLGVDGLIFIGLARDTGLLEFLESRRIPFVNTWTTDPDRSIPCIGFDNRTAIKRITEYVLAKGHRDVAMVVGGATHINERTAARRQGFCDAFAERGLDAPDHLISEVPYGITSGRDTFRKIWSGAERPTAIVCGSDLLAIGLLMESQRQAVRIPDDLSVTGFDDLVVGANFYPSLTTMHVPSREMGAAAASYLLAVLDGEHPEANVTLPCELIERETVAELVV